MPAGRPRAFNTKKALDRALYVFWRMGYEGASLLILTKAMGINRPSLYSAFGNKEELFRKALDRYIEGPAAYFLKAIQQPTIDRVVHDLLHGAIDLLTNPRNPGGCLVVQGALASGDAVAPVRKELSLRRAWAQSTIRERFERAAREGELPGTAKAPSLARYISTIMLGMAVQAKGGATKEELLEVAARVLKNWRE